MRQSAKLTPIPAQDATRPPNGGSLSHELPKGGISQFEQRPSPSSILTPSSAALHLESFLAKDDLRGAARMIVHTSSFARSDFPLIWQELSKSPNLPAFAGRFVQVCREAPSHFDPLPAFKMLMEHESVSPDLKIAIFKSLRVSQADDYRDFRRAALSDSNPIVRNHVLSISHAKISELSSFSQRDTFTLALAHDALLSPHSDVHTMALPLFLKELPKLLASPVTAGRIETLIMQDNGQVGALLFDQIFIPLSVKHSERSNILNSFKTSANIYVAMRCAAELGTMPIDRFGAVSKILNGEIPCPVGMLDGQTAAAQALVALFKNPAHKGLALPYLKEAASKGNLGTLTTLANICDQLGTTGVDIGLRLADRVIAETAQLRQQILDRVKKVFNLYPGITAAQISATSPQSIGEEKALWRIQTMQSLSSTHQPNEKIARIGFSPVTPLTVFEFATRFVENGNGARVSALQVINSELTSMVGSNIVCRSAVRMLRSAYEDTRLTACKMLGDYSDKSPPHISVLKSVLRHDSSENVRKAANDSLKRLNVSWISRAYAARSAPELPPSASKKSQTLGTADVVWQNLDEVVGQQDANFMPLLDKTEDPLTSIPDIDEFLPPLNGPQKT